MIALGSPAELKRSLGVGHLLNLESSDLLPTNGSKTNGSKTNGSGNGAVQIVTENPKGEVFVLGNDSFCIAAFNGLRTAGFKGQVTAIPNCLATRGHRPGAWPCRRRHSSQIGIQSALRM